MKSYIYLGLTLLSISICNAQAAEKSWLEELTERKDRVPNVVAGVVGGTVAALTAVAIAEGVGKGNLTILAAGDIAGGLAGSALADHLRPHDRDVTALIAFWTSFIGLQYLRYIIK